MMNENEIGGYFELELSQQKKPEFLHSDGILVNLGNSAFEIILRAMPKLGVVWLSYFTCESVLEPLQRLGLTFQFYRIKENFEIDESTLSLSHNDCLVYNNYFGLKDVYIHDLYARYGEQLIIDNAQSYGTPHINNSNTLYSPRKSFGVPDGGVAYINDKLKPVDIEAYELDHSFDRCAHLLKRMDLSASEGYADFKSNSKILHSLPVRRMSNLTKTMLASIDYDTALRIRQQNFLYLQEQLKGTNSLAFVCCNLKADFFPAFYPYYSEDDNLRQYLIDNKIFVALYWPNVLTWLQHEQNSIEFKMAKNIIPIPVDQRYNSDNMEKIVKLLKR